MSPEALDANQSLVDLLKQVAEQKKATAAQIAVAGVRYPEELEKRTGL